MAVQKPAPGLPRPRGIIFDWDDTLVDNWGVIADSINVALTAYGKPAWTYAEVKARVRHSARDSFPVLFGAEHAEAAMRIFYDHFKQHHLAHLIPKDGAIELLDTLRDDSVPLFVVSNKNGFVLRREAAHLGWEDRFHRLVGAADAPKDKPAPDAVHMALEGSGLSAGPEIWFVGDKDIDLACAVAAGCTPVLIGSSPDVDINPAPKLAISDCSSLRSAIGY